MAKSEDAKSTSAPQLTWSSFKVHPSSSESELDSTAYALEKFKLYETRAVRILDAFSVADNFVFGLIMEKFIDDEC